MAIPTLIFGPFGPIKILFGIGTGLIYEVTTFALKRTPMSYIVAAGVSAFVSVYLIYFGSIWLVGAPSPTLAKYRDYFAVAYAILGALGGFIGTRVFIRIQRNTASVVEASTK